jgi:hypothetical protein
MPAELGVVPLLASTVFGLLFGGSGSLLLYGGAATLRTTVRRGRFETVPATVVSSELDRTETDVGSGTGTATYQPRIEYEYTVGAETYTGDSVYPGTVTGSDDEGEERSVVERYEEGDTVTAYHHPEDPSRSFLEDESTLLEGIVTFGLGAALAVVGVVLLAGVVSVLAPT